MNKKRLYTHSVNLAEDILHNRRPDSPPELRMIRTGYEGSLGAMYILDNLIKDPDFEIYLNHNKGIIQTLAWAIQPFAEVIQETEIPLNSFQRITLAMEKYEGQEPWSSVEIALAVWGKGFEVPIHGHADGWMHEQILSGKIEYKFYDVVDPDKRTVKLTKTFIGTDGYIGSAFYESESPLDHSTMIHSFTVLEDTVSLHFLPAKPGDGKDFLFTLDENEE